MNKEYKRWKSFEGLDAETRDRLDAISNDENAIAERFLVPMSFGTAGLRSTMDIGISKMNVYTVAQTTQGLAELIKEVGGELRGVAVCYDSRNNSRLFAETAASVLAGNGIRVRIFDGIRPTPELSFAILMHGCIAGINITASHNPKEYNGYKVYWEDGAQLPPEHAASVSESAAITDIFKGVKKAVFADAVGKGIISYMSDETDEAFLNAVLNCRICPETTKKFGNELHIVYTALHGTGYKLVPEILKRCGITNLVTVDRQMIPDGNFPTVASPNPENRECFELAVKLVKEKKINCGMIIATDPDGDRVGLAIRDESGSFFALNGNQIGALLIDYIIKARKKSGALPANACAIRSVVSSRLFDAICEKSGVQHISVLTGFKYIGEKIKEWEEDGIRTFIFGYEESQGYLAGGYARDKDAVGAAAMLAEAAAFHKSEGRSLYTALCDLYKEYGFYRESVVNVKIAGIDPMTAMSDRMRSLRTSGIGLDITSSSDYLAGVTVYSNGKTAEIGLPKSDMLSFTLDDGSEIIVRPSGTEPKIKAYILVRADDNTKAQVRLDELCAHCEKLLS